MTVEIVTSLAEAHRAARLAWWANFDYYERGDPVKAATYVATFEASKTAYLVALARLSPADRALVLNVEQQHIARANRQTP